MRSCDHTYEMLSIMGSAVQIDVKDASSYTGGHFSQGLLLT